MLACGKISSIAYKLKARMQSFKSFGNFLQFLNGDWRQREKNRKTSGVERNTAALEPKVNNSDTLTGLSSASLFFRLSALSSVGLQTTFGYLDTRPTGHSANWTIGNWIIGNRPTRHSANWTIGQLNTRSLCFGLRSFVQMRK